MQMKKKLYFEWSKIFTQSQRKLYHSEEFPCQHKKTLKTMIANEILIENGNYVCPNQFYTKMIFLLYISETSLWEIPVNLAF